MQLFTIYSNWLHMMCAGNRRANTDILLATSLLLLWLCHLTYGESTSVCSRSTLHLILDVQLRVHIMLGKNSAICWFETPYLVKATKMLRLGESSGNTTPFISQKCNKDIINNYQTGTLGKLLVNILFIEYVICWYFNNVSTDNYSLVSYEHGSSHCK